MRHEPHLDRQPNYKDCANHPRNPHSPVPYCAGQRNEKKRKRSNQIYPREVIELDSGPAEKSTNCPVLICLAQLSFVIVPHLGVIESSLRPGFLPNEVPPHCIHFPVGVICHAERASRNAVIVITGPSRERREREHQEQNNAS